MEPAIRCVDVSKQYRLGITRTSLLNVFSHNIRRVLKPDPQEVHQDQTIWALRDVNFELSKGESLGLIGQNGAGKSTLLKLLAYITRPTYGQIEINGRLSALIELGTGFHPELTGRENIYLNGTILGLSPSEIRHRFDEIVDFSELDKFIDTPIKRYSSGMTVRLGFSVAALIDPDVLLVDEVLAVGDASFRQKCIGRIQTLLENGTSIVFVSHNLYMVKAVCRNSLYISRGRIKHHGNTSEVINRYERDLHEERASRFDSEITNQATNILFAEIVEVELLSRNSSPPSEEFYSTQSVEVRIHYRVFHKGGNANAVVRVVRSDGVTCCMMRTSIDEYNLVLGEGNGVISIILEPLQLTGGSYYIEAFITDEMDSVVLATGISNWFYVSGKSLSHETQSGVFEPRRQWKHVETSQ